MCRGNGSNNDRRNDFEQLVDRDALVDFHIVGETGPGVFVREDEILRLEFLAPGGVSSAPSSLTVHFILRPLEK